MIDKDLSEQIHNDLIEILYSLPPGADYNEEIKPHVSALEALKAEKEPEDTKYLLECIHAAFNHLDDTGNAKDSVLIQLTVNCDEIERLNAINRLLVAYCRNYMPARKCSLKDIARAMGMSESYISKVASSQSANRDIETILNIPHSNTEGYGKSYL